MTRRAFKSARESHGSAGNEHAELDELRRMAASRRRGAGAPAPQPPADVPEPAWRVRPQIHPLRFDERRIDPDAAKVVGRLLRSGFEAYLVGGCVRDLLLDKHPKDFDVATSARPDDIRAVFRNSRIIGRRFRLVHVLFADGKVIETATFRRNPNDGEGQEGDDLLIRSDNAFGDAWEDANRRDFTINALFYDISRQRVLDWVGGMPDIERRAIHTIGDPSVRFLEDPVRILRAIKFAARLDLGITPEVYDAMVQCRGALAMAARPRLLEELLRFLRSGHAHRSFWLAWETGVLDVLLPELSAFMSDTEATDGRVFRLLDALDNRVRQGAQLDDVVLFTTLMLEPLCEACAGAEDRVSEAGDFLEPIVERLTVPRRIIDGARRVVAMLPRIVAGRTGRFSRTSLFPIAQQVLEIRAEADGRGAHKSFPPVVEGERRRRRRSRAASSR